MDCHIHRSHVRRGARLVVALMTLTLSAATGHAAGDDPSAARHVRTFDSTMNALIAEGARRSEMFRTLVGRLNRSTVFVYVESQVLPGNLTGRLTFVGSGQPWRYLRIEIECRQSTPGQIAALGHELQHAVEIADRPAVVDESSIRALYGTIGFAIDNTGRRFESHAAKDAARRILQDWYRFKTISSDLD